MGIDLGCFDILVAELFLHGTDIRTRFEQVGRERVPQRMTGDMSGAPIVIDVAQRPIKIPVVQESKRIQGNTLCGGSNIPLYRKIRLETFDFRIAHLCRMLFVAINDVVTNPVKISFNRALAVTTQHHIRGNRIEKRGGPWHDFDSFQTKTPEH